MTVKVTFQRHQRLLEWNQFFRLISIRINNSYVCERRIKSFWTNINTANRASAVQSSGNINGE